MSHTTSGSGSEDKDQADSSFLEETSSSRKKSGGGRTSLKKGPWTSAEDAILVEYVRTYGEGNWNSVQKQSGLSRCGKSCRLRWANHLRGNLKKGTFTAEEERLIVELHSKFGNKWALMAAYLPGRTDNEIKNYWNTRVKRCQRAGLPLYPPDLCLQTLNESLQVQATDEFLSPEPQNQGAHEKNYDIPDVIFDHFEGNQSLLSLPPTIPDLSSVSSMLTQGPIPSQTYGLQPSTPPAKRFRPETFLPDFSFGAELPPGSMELELPSLQYPDHGMGNWNTTSVQAALLDNIDAFLESLSPSQILSEPILSDCSSPMNNLLLDALLYEAQILNYNNNQSSEKSSASCVGTPGDIVDGLDVVFSDPGWEEFVDPVSPLGSSVASICTEHAPVSGPGSSQEQQAPKDLTGFYVKPEWVEQVATSDGRKESNEKSKTDALLTMDWSEIAECFKDQSNVLYDLSTLLGGDGWN